MLLQVTATPDPRLIAAALRRCLRYPLLLARGAGWLIIAIAVLLAVFTTDGLDPVLLIGGLLLSVGLPIFTISNATRRLLRASRLTTYEISDTGVASANVDARHAYAWRAFSYVEHAPGRLVFGRDRLRFLPMPTAGLTSAQIAQVLATAGANGLRVRH